MESRPLNQQSTMDHFLAVAKEAILIHSTNLVIQVFAMGISKGICAIGSCYVEKQYLISRLPQDMPSASLD